MDNSRSTWAEIDLTALRNNIDQIKRLAHPAKIMAVVKADAYGHGILPIGQVCEEKGVEYLGVAVLEEAIKLRQAGIKIPILLLGYMDVRLAEEAVAYDVSVTVFENRLPLALSYAAQKLGRPACIHIKTDTGMGRLGFAPQAETLREIIKISRLPGIIAEGLFTHFANSDDSDKSFARTQLQLFHTLLDQLKAEGLEFPILHSANSAAVMEIPEAAFNMVRAGIMLYGLSPFIRADSFYEKFRPLMTLKSCISFIKTMQPGQTVSYGRTYCCTGETTVAVVPIGYADGYSRLLSNRGWSIIRGQKAPLIGRVCMDQCMFDVTAITGARAGDEVILFGTENDGVTADNIAEIMDTINYEVVCGISPRVPRVYI